MRKLEEEGSKRRNIAELVGYKDSGGEMVRKVKFEAVQGSAPTISVRCLGEGGFPVGGGGQVDRLSGGGGRGEGGLPV